MFIQTQSIEFEIFKKHYWKIHCCEWGGRSRRLFFLSRDSDAHAKSHCPKWAVNMGLTNFTATWIIINILLIYWYYTMSITCMKYLTIMTCIWVLRSCRPLETPAFGTHTSTEGRSSAIIFANAAVADAPQGNRGSSTTSEGRVVHGLGGPGPHWCNKRKSKGKLALGLGTWAFSWHYVPYLCISRILREISEVMCSSGFWKRLGPLAKVLE